MCSLEEQVPVLFGGDAQEVPGARDLLSSLDHLKARWAIVTSGTRPLVKGWLQVLGLVEPSCMVTAEAVQHGKPDPECYMLAAQQLGLAMNDDHLPLVLEDAPAGVRAGKAAGFVVVALATTHTVAELEQAGADWIVPDLSYVMVSRDGESSTNLQVHLKSLLG